MIDVKQLISEGKLKPSGDGAPDCFICTPQFKAFAEYPGFTEWDREIQIASFDGAGCMFNLEGYQLNIDNLIKINFYQLLELTDDDY